MTVLLFKPLHGFEDHTFRGTPADEGDVAARIAIEPWRLHVLFTKGVQLCEALAHHTRTRVGIFGRIAGFHMLHARGFEDARLLRWHGTRRDTAIGDEVSFELTI